MMKSMRRQSASTGGKRPLCIGQYEILAHIATGGMGAVYKALDIENQRPVALKILAAEMASKPSVVERFKREGRSAAKLKHENVVALYESGEFNGTHFLAYEFVDGRDLHDYIARRRQLGLKEARHILIQAAKALSHAHAKQIVHRDIKPSNFLIAKDKDGRILVKLTDLGLARQVNDYEFRVTTPDATIGTVDYLSPEQALNSGMADIRSDIYSLGCTFYHMLAGKCPFPTGNLVERLLQHRESEPPDVRVLNPAVPEPVVTIIRKMMAKKPDDRYQTPEELLEDLINAANFPSSPGSSARRRSARSDAKEKKPRKKRAEPAEPPVPRTDESARRDKTLEDDRPGSEPQSENKSRFRDPPSEEPETKQKKSWLPGWWPWKGE
jgi:serine/threonine protein kinase